MRRLLWPLIAAALLAGCTQHFEHNRNAFQNARPATEAEIDGILEGARNVLYDPYSVRDAEISKVVEVMDAFGTRTKLVCVRFNSKNAFGGYTGRQQYLLNLRQNRVILANQDMFAQAHCNKMTYIRFHEANRLRDL